MLKDYNFRCVLSFKPLYDQLDELELASPGAACLLGHGLRDQLAAASELLNPMEDLRVLQKHWPLVESLMALLFSPVSWRRQPQAAIVPVKMEPFYWSPPFRDLFMGPGGGLRVRRNLDQESFDQGRAIMAYLFILQKVYGIEEHLEYPIVFLAPDPRTGLDRSFNFQFDSRFVDVRPLGRPKELSVADRDRVLENLTRPDVLREILPPEDFEIFGFTAVHAVDVTETEVVSALERDLIDQRSIISQEGFSRLENRLRIYFKRPDLSASLAAINGDQVMFINKGSEIKKSCIFGDSLHKPLAVFQGTIYQRALESDGVLLASDVLKEPLLEPMYKDLINADARSLIVAPLYYQGGCIGALTIKTPTAGDLGPLDALQMSHLQPMFAMAVNKILHDLENRIQNIIKEQCTAIHPSVEWRFRQAAFNVLENLRRGGSARLEPIVFKDVYPLFATADTRSSSDARNQAIAADLMEHLDLGLKVVLAAGRGRPMPILDELAGRIGKLRERISSGLHSGDENLVVNFLNLEVESIFDYLASLGPEAGEAVAAYKEAVDENLGVVYRRRRDFELGVQQLNDQLAAYLDAEEAALQKDFPHYYERRRTDGVDYTIYLGSSLPERDDFSKLHLKNFRLWQIIVSCGLAWHTEQIKPSLSVPLDTAHLILIHNAPLAIRFRYDEKRFDVDGAYGIRYETIRSRLDKAVIKDTGQRLTQPGRVAMVYTHPAEAREMVRHLEFLQYRGFLAGELERLELDDLPGVQGLRAMRMKVDLESPALAERARSMMGG